MNPTPEQQLIINSPLKRIKVIAFAGAAKSTTLIMYAQARPDAKILLVCFNKANQVEAEKKFPPNVTSLTTHSLAIRSCGNQYRHKLVSDLRVNDIALLFNSQYQVANGIISTLKRYIVSDTESMNASHLDYLICTNKNFHGFILQKANLLWQMMCDPTSTIGMLHDGYLKLYQLSKPKLDTQYDIILFEEAQDSNPVTTSIIKSQGKCGLVVVGDPHQSIYSFRGSSNALNDFEVDGEFFLTKSFRFGNGIADVANLLLSKFKAEPKKVVGAGKYADTLFSIDTSKYFAIISRTNAALFDEAVNLIKTNKVPHFVGGIKGYRMNDILDAYYLYAGENFKIKSHLKSHKSWSEFDQYTDESRDPECLILRKIVNNYKDEIPKLIDEITRKSVDDFRKADVTLTTAHKSKGLEFDQVLLTNDFPELIKDNKINLELELEDVNLLYVTITRAERAIQLNDHTKAFLTFSQFSLSDSIPQDDTTHSIKPIQEAQASAESLWLRQAKLSAMKRDIRLVTKDARELLAYLENECLKITF